MVPQPQRCKFIMGTYTSLLLTTLLRVALILELTRRSLMKIDDFAILLIKTPVHKLSAVFKFAVLFCLVNMHYFFKKSEMGPVSAYYRCNKCVQSQHKVCNGDW